MIRCWSESARCGRKTHRSWHGFTEWVKQSWAGSGRMYLKLCAHTANVQRVRRCGKSNPACEKFAFERAHCGCYTHFDEQSFPSRIGKWQCPLRLLLLLARVWRRGTDALAAAKSLSDS